MKHQQCTPYEFKQLEAREQAKVELQSACTSARKQMSQDIKILTKEDFILLAEFMQNLKFEKANYETQPFSQLHDVTSIYHDKVLECEKLKELIIDENFIEKNDVDQIVERLEPATSALILNQGISTQQQLDGCIAHDATYLSEYINKNQNGQINGIHNQQNSRNKQQQTQVQKLQPLKNLFLFVVSLFDATFSSFIAAGYFSTKGNAGPNSDKFVFALQKLYLKFNVHLKFFVFDGDTHNYFNFVVPLFTWIWQRKAQNDVMSLLTQFYNFIILMDKEIERFEKTVLVANNGKNQKQLKMRQALDLNIMKTLWVRTITLQYVLENYSNINMFALSSNVVECQFGQLKNLCHNKQTTTIMKGVLEKYIQNQSANLLLSTDQQVPKQRLKYARVMQGKNKITSNEKRSLTQIAQRIYGAVSNKSPPVLNLEEVAGTFKQLDEKFHFSNIKLLQNYQYSEKGVQELNVNGLMEQGKIAKIMGTGQYIKQENITNSKKHQKFQ